jgi:hypothetical protein
MVGRHDSGRFQPMRKAFVAALSATLAGGLIWTAIGGGATTRVSEAAFGDADARSAMRAARTYEGPFKNAGDATISIKAKIKRGEATKVTRIAYEDLGFNCEVSGKGALSGEWTLAGVGVNDKRKFKAVGNDGGPPGQQSSLRFKGRFNKRFTKVRGTFQTTVYFPPENPPEEHCTSTLKRYTASK